MDVDTDMRVITDPSDPLYLPPDAFSPASAKTTVPSSPSKATGVVTNAQLNERVMASMDQRKMAVSNMSRLAAGLSSNPNSKALETKPASLKTVPPPALQDGKVAPTKSAIVQATQGVVPAKFPASNTPVVKPAASKPAAPPVPPVVNKPAAPPAVKPAAPPVVKPAPVPAATTKPSPAPTAKPAPVAAAVSKPAPPEVAPPSKPAPPEPTPASKPAAPVEATPPIAKPAAPVPTPVPTTLPAPVVPVDVNAPDFEAERDDPFGTQATMGIVLPVKEKEPENAGGGKPKTIKDHIATIIDDTELPSGRLLTPEGSGIKFPAELLPKPAPPKPIEEQTAPVPTDGIKPPGKPKKKHTEKKEKKDKSKKEKKVKSAEKDKKEKKTKKVIEEDSVEAPKKRPSAKDKSSARQFLLGGGDDGGDDDDDLSEAGKRMEVKAGEEEDILTGEDEPEVAEDLVESNLETAEDIRRAKLESDAEEPDEYTNTSSGNFIATSDDEVSSDSSSSDPNGKFSAKRNKEKEKRRKEKLLREKSDKKEKAKKKKEVQEESSEAESDEEAAPEAPTPMEQDAAVAPKETPVDPPAASKPKPKKDYPKPKSLYDFSDEDKQVQAPAPAPVKPPPDRALLDKLSVENLPMAIAGPAPSKPAAPPAPTQTKSAGLRINLDDLDNIITALPPVAPDDTSSSGKRPIEPIDVDKNGKRAKSIAAGKGVKIPAHPVNKSGFPMEQENIRPYLMLAAKDIMLTTMWASTMPLPSSMEALQKQSTICHGAWMRAQMANSATLDYDMASQLDHASIMRTFFGRADDGADVSLFDTARFPPLPTLAAMVLHDTIIKPAEQHKAPFAALLRTHFTDRADTTDLFLEATQLSEKVGQMDIYDWDDANMGAPKGSAIAQFRLSINILGDVVKWYDMCRSRFKMGQLMLQCAALHFRTRVEDVVTVLKSEVAGQPERVEPLLRKVLGSEEATAMVTKAIASLHTNWESAIKYYYGQNVFARVAKSKI